MLKSIIGAVLTISVALGQMNTGEIGGTVRDQLGGQIPGAALVAEQAATGLKFTAAANPAGAYLFPALPVGAFTLGKRASAASFKQAVLPAFEVHAGERLEYDFTLPVGEATETVTVEAGGEGEQKDSAEIKDLIGGQRAVGLPVESRQYLDLAMLSPGVVRPPGGDLAGDALQQAGTLDQRAGPAQRADNLYLLDGVTITDEDYNNMVVAPSLDGIGEISIQKTSYAPEFGGKSGSYGDQRHLEIGCQSVLSRQLAGVRPQRRFRTRRISSIRMPLPSRPSIRNHNSAARAAVRW